MVRLIKGQRGFKTLSNAVIAVVGDFVLMAMGLMLGYYMKTVFL